MLPSPVSGMDLSAANDPKAMCYSSRIYSDINKLMGLDAKQYLDNRIMYPGSYPNHPRSMAPMKTERQDLNSYHSPYLQLPASTHCHTSTHS